MPIFTGEISLEDNKKGQLFWLMHIYFKFLHATLLLGTLEPLGGGIRARKRNAHFKNIYMFKDGALFCFPPTIKIFERNSPKNLRLA